MSESSPSSVPQKPPSTDEQRRWPLVVVAGVLLVVVAVVLIFFISLQGKRGKTNPGIPLEVAKSTPDTATSPLPSPPPSCETIISSDDVEVAAPIPISLTVSGKTIPVAPILFEGGEPLYPQGQSGPATWVCGTVVNYILGLEPTAESENLVDGLRSGDEIDLRLSNGTVLHFRFNERQEVEVDNANALKQQRPRLTLVLEKGGKWQVATADYVSETESAEPTPSGTGTEVGQPVRVGDTQVTVLKGHPKRGGGDLPSGSMYYLVEFSVKNTGSAPLEARAFSTKLKDGVGNSYLLSPKASAAGEHGPLTGTIEPGTQVQGTAGYLVPDPLAGPKLTWLFIPQPGSDAQATIDIPHKPESEPTSSPARANVNITDAFLDDEVIIIVGKIQNEGEQALEVREKDISLTSNAGPSALRSAAPLLPWTIQPGGSQEIELQYERPEASTALLELLGYSFEIGGL